MHSDNPPKISVISACYDQGRYIREMIESILNQSFQDLELIIVDDGSSDETRFILDEIKDSRITVIHSGHRGHSHARNLAIGHARADIILNLDADDKIAGDLLGKAYNVLSENSNAGIVYTECVYFGARRGAMKPGHYCVENMLLSNRIVSAAFFRKEDWVRCGGYSESFRYGLEDWDFWLSIIESGRDVIKIPDSCFYYRTYDNHLASRGGRLYSDRARAIESLMLIYERHKELISKYPSALRRFRNYEMERNSWIIKYARNLIFPLRFKIAGFLR